jgi:HAD-superfamily subfamily IB hydrolase, TIGR01490
MPDGTGVVERLAGSHVLLTGVTGFVGEALLHRLLTEVPDARLSVLVRPRGSTSAAERVRALLKKPIFAVAAERAGGLDELAGRVNVAEGDIAQVPPLPADLDAVVHCAGDVSFDPPVDAAFTTNVVGTRELLRRVAELGEHVHYVHVSTAYVAGRRRGMIRAAPVEHDVDVDAELAWGLAQRDLAEQRSRDADRLAGFRAAAERDHRRAGPLVAANAVEERRKAWVRDELVRLGTERARSLGWTDCYTFTKALGERVVETRAADAPVSIVRPSIIESALLVPHPGWIEGFKMAEPLILAYGRGEMPEFPAPGDAIIDIVPVDHVVAAIVAVLAHPPAPGAPAYFHVSSGSSNPLSYFGMYSCVRQYFDEHPFETGERGATRLPDMHFPGAQWVERRLATGERAHKVADRVLSFAPRGDRTREFARSLDRQGRRLEFLRRHFDLYREYVETDLRFDNSHTRALFESLSPADRERFAFDPAQIDWDHYIREVHCPAVTAPIRRLDEARRRRSRGSTPGIRPVDAAGGTRVAAFFDLDGTLLSSNVIETFLWTRLSGLSGTERLAEIGRVAARVPGLVRAERHERSAFLRAIYRRYEGARLADLEAIVDESLTDHVLSRLAPAAVRRVREHRAAGQPTVLITGAILPLTRPLAPLFDRIEAADLAVDADGVCTGLLTAPPLVGEARAAWMRAWAAEHDVDLGASFGYADSYSDLPLLDAVGHPVAVRPDVALSRHARRKHWPTVDWASPSAAARRLDPARTAR